MIYELYELKGYTRLGLNSIKLIRLTMSEIVQVILGRNGSGKSSLLAELNPFPADSKFFNSDGHKLVVIKNGLDRYQIKSTFKPSTKHSFIKNDEELNPGGTSTVQKDLCKQHLGVTPDIVGVITGAEKFSTMSPQRRRELLTLMCDTDYDYAIKVYNRVTTALRDTTGALKLTKKRLVAEVTNVFTDQDYKAAQEQLNELTQKSQELYQLKNTTVPDLPSAVDKIDALKRRIKEVATKFWDIRRTLITNDTFLPSEIQNDIEDIKARIQRCTALIEADGARFDEVQKRIADSGAIEDSEYLMLTKQAADIAEIMQTHLRRIKTPLEGINVSEATQTCERIKQSLMDALIALPSNESQWFTKDKYEQLQTRLDNLKVNTVTLKEQLFKINHFIERLEAAKQHDEAQCPNCEHKFLPGYSEDKYQEMLALRTTYTDKIKEAQATMAKEQESFDDMTEYRRQRQVVRDIAQSSGAIKIFWDTNASDEVLCNSPTMLFTKFEHFEADLKNLAKANDYKAELASIQFRIDSANNARQRDVEQDKKTALMLEAAVLQNVNERRVLNIKLTEATTYQRHVKMMLEVGDVMRNLKDQLENSIKDGSSAIVNELIDKALVQTHSEIATLSARISDMRTRINLIADIKKQIATLEDDEKAYKLIASTLSPTDGLIAEGLLGFIRAYVKSVNKIIKKFWTYRMEVKDCSTEEGSADLNYRFPLDVEGDKLARNDIKDGSSGMREAIDLAFRFVAMHYTGLSDYPLFLDEFGAFFDAEHKSRAPYAIKSVIDQMQFSQVFIISHHEMEYNAFPNAQFCVLDKNNILLSSEIKYNEHVIIE